MTRKLVFTYNADSGIASFILDAGHRVVSPSTYKCNLCKITYGPFGQRGKWKKFIETLDGEVEFVHADEFLKLYKKTDIKHPSLYDPGLGKSLMQRSDFDSVTDIDELISAVRAAL